MRHSRAIVLWASLSGLAATAFAQSGTTTILDISLSPSPLCKNVSEVFAVMLDNEGKTMSVDKTDPEHCHWTLNTKGPRFNTNVVHFSLRLGRARTRCAVPHWDSGKARIEFSVLGSAQQITFTADPSMPLPYAREVQGDEYSVPCTETGKLSEPLWNVRDVDFSMENLRLRDLESKKDICGLLVNSLPAIKKKKVSVALNVKTLGDALSRQRAGKDHCQMPNLSSPAIDITETKLIQRGLKTLSVTVK